MKFKAFLKNLSIVLIIVCVVFASVFCVYAEDETEPAPQETQVQEVTEPIQEETDPPQEPETEETTEETEPATEETTEKKTEATTEETTEETTKQAEENQEETQDTTQRKTLPTISKAEPETKPQNDGDLTYGYVSWACVVAGVLLLAIVLLSTFKIKSNR